MQLREILDLERDAVQGTVGEQVEGAEEEGDEISEKTAGTSFKEEDEPEEASSDDDDDMTERARRARRTMRRRTTPSASRR